MTTGLWHYTCSHSHARLGDNGRLVPAWDLYTEQQQRQLPAELQPITRFVWLTDLETPIPEALGLTRAHIRCDRTRFRYRVQDGRAWIARYAAIRRSLTVEARAALETAPGVMPMHWWVAREPVAVVYDPLPVPAGRTR